MKPEFRIIPLDHPAKGWIYVAWIDLAGAICVGSAEHTTMTEDSKIMAVVKIRKDSHMPICAPLVADNQPLDDLTIYQLCGLKEKLLYKWPRVFIEEQPPLKYA